ncbi:hypothetical protein IEE_02392 [Bacillus cereus BAG5X1-1]|uniref:AAA+ ATPase domain-containing protein n=1 Tax=Bacillus cereus BAG5X1-1 TaxID=1053189 RepID=J8AAE0_BACCE|nr:AAA family ATPase [Bacillus cereus]EJQ45511.1 hypothetical protein IEE_02392 [Bacillus cereus BAG5X1-1]MDM5462933.1 AAA family ATPase [Bacillus cereus]PGY09853.1 hypothetical protein COE23_23135 [Bacillus cereus]WJE18058.1 AAA family ATPase [Bacillus cereus]
MLFWTKKKLALQIYQKQTGYWALASDSSVLMSFLEKTEAKEMKKKIEPALQEWDGTGNVLDYLYDAEKYYIYDLCVDAREKYRASERYNFVDGLVKGQQIDILLAPVNSIEEMVVNGEFVNTAFGIYLSDKWNIVHLPSGKVYAEGLEKEQAVKLIEAFMHYNDKMCWGTVQSHFDFYANQDMFNTLVAIKRDIELNKYIDYSEYAWGPEWNEFMAKWNKLFGIEYFADLIKRWKRDAYELKNSDDSRSIERILNDQKHIVLKGPSGVGKSTIVEYLAEALYLLGLMPENKCVEITRRDLAPTSTGSVESKLNEFIQEAEGGILFIDEAYSLKSANSNEDMQLVLDGLLDVLGGRRGTIVVVLAGYSYDMEKLLDSNEGLRSRFTSKNIIELKEMTPDELGEFFVSEIENMGYEVERGLGEKASLMFYNMRKANKLNGNLRSVKGVIEELRDINRDLIVSGVRDKYAFDAELLTKLKRVPVTNQDRKMIQHEAKKRMDGLYGLEGVKRDVQERMDILDSIRIEREEKSWLDDDVEKVNLNMMIVGEPGTAKTEIAEIMGEYLKGSGFLKNGNFYKVVRDDLVGQYIGDTALKTKEVLKKATGSILFIDEAHNLAEGGENDFGKEALRTVMEYVYANSGDIACILAVYPDKLDKLYSVDPGIKSRFREPILLGNYTPYEIIQIMKNVLKKNKLELSEEVLSALEIEVRNFGERNNNIFDGNGRWAVETAKTILEKKRVKAVIEVEDIRKIFNAKSGIISVDEKRQEGQKDLLRETWDKLDQLEGMENVKKQFKDMETKLRIQKAKQEKGIPVRPLRLHASIEGDSGVGKTTIAEIYSSLLWGMGYLSKGTLCQVTKKDLAKNTLEETTDALKQSVAKAKGGVLFLDEAYGLATDSMGHEVIRELLPYLEEKDWAFVMAGYKQDMEALYEANEGLRSRIGSIFTLDSYNYETIGNIVIKQLNHYKWEDGVKEALFSGLQMYESKFGSFDGNGRWAVDFAEKIEGEQEIRLGNETELTNDSYILIKEIDITKALNSNL